MLSQLSIKNYALIEQLSVDFKNRLSTITGETGAGKSILLGALSLVLGKRADLSNLKDTSTKCIIEAQFTITDNFISFFEENELDFEKETIIRREILPSGKSRAFINDTPTTLQVLSSISKRLIDIHSQHETQLLLDKNFQFQLIDALADTTDKVASYQRGLQVLKTLQKELATLRETQQKGQEQFEYHTFLFNELAEADLQENEQKELENNLEKLNHVEEIKTGLSAVQKLIQNDEIGIETQLSSCESQLQNISKYGKEYEQILVRIQSTRIEITDLISEVENQNERLEFYPDEIEKCNDRLQLIYNLQKKHQVDSIKDLLNVQSQLNEKLNRVTDASIDISKKEKEITEVTSKIDKLALNISKDRKKAIPIFIKELEALLHLLHMKNTRFKIQLEHTNSYFSQGKDELDFLASTNKGSSFENLKKIASGGEMSRIMLSIKAILSNYLELPTIIFDEIDTGVSGEVAQKMGEIMSNMSKNMQVITITHLPQIAVKGQQHYKVYKEELQNQVTTKLKILHKEERIMEIAEMLEGKNFSETARLHAQKLLNLKA